MRELSFESKRLREDGEEVGNNWHGGAKQNGFGLKAYVTVQLLS